MAADRAAFQEWFPGEPFSGLEPAAIDRAIAEARQLHDWNEIATIYLAAHLLAVDTEQGALQPDGGSGVVQSEQIGPRRINYLTQAGEDERRAFYATTPWGRRFLALEDRTARVGIGATVV